MKFYTYDLNNPSKLRMNKPLFHAVKEVSLFFFFGVYFLLLFCFYMSINRLTKECMSKLLI